MKRVEKARILVVVIKKIVDDKKIGIVVSYLCIYTIFYHSKTSRMNFAPVKREKVPLW